MFGAGFINNFFSELLETHKVGSLFYLSLVLLVILRKISIDEKKKEEATSAPEIEAHITAVRTNHKKARIYQKQKNSISSYAENINPRRRKFCNLLQKEDKTRNEWVGKEMCKKLKFDHANKWYMHNPESVLENETHKLLWDFEIQMDHLISARRPNLIIINKKERTCRIVDFVVPVELKECEKKDKYFDLTRELKKLWNMKVTIIPIVIGALGTVTKRLVQGLEDLEITGRVETVQTTALLRSARILSRVL